MNKLFIVFALVGAIIAAPTQNAESYGVIKCFDELLVSFEPINVKELVADARQTIGYLLERYRYCQEIPRDDPPTHLQEIKIEACEKAWQLTVAIELARLSTALNQHTEKRRDLVAEFSECSGISFD
ncbi:uncharacterized protein LOC134214060 [Armigeres subalbatus]|uniref:uncharacterized protein LOC134214060 n=1 Tax=Armigeres subalbatus TaxID=124917 RepID=UPI002ED21B79